MTPFCSSRAPRRKQADGENDYILRVAARDVNDFGRVHSTYLSSLPHVLRMESRFVLREVMNRGMKPSQI